jgi:hypothetical protein
VQRQHHDFLSFLAMRREFTPFADENEVVGAGSVLHDIEAFLNLTPQLQQPEITTEENRPAGFAQFHEGFIRGMVQIVAWKASQDGFGLCGPQPQRRGIFDHVVILWHDHGPVNGPSEHGVQMGIRLRMLGVRPV